MDDYLKQHIEAKLTLDSYVQDTVYVVGLLFISEWTEPSCLMSKSHLTLQTWHWASHSTKTKVSLQNKRFPLVKLSSERRAWPNSHSLPFNRGLAPQLPNGSYWLEGNACSAGSKCHPFWCWLCWVLQSLDSELQPFVSPTTMKDNRQPTVSQVRMCGR